MIQGITCSWIGRFLQVKYTIFKRCLVICYSGGEIVGDKILEASSWLGKDSTRVCRGDDEGPCGD